MVPDCRCFLLIPESSFFLMIWSLSYFVFCPLQTTEVSRIIDHSQCGLPLAQTAFLSFVCSKYRLFFSAVQTSLAQDPTEIQISGPKRSHSSVALTSLVLVFRRPWLNLIFLGLEAFSFDYVVKWPVSLVLSRKVKIVVFWKDATSVTCSMNLMKFTFSFLGSYKVPVIISTFVLRQTRRETTLQDLVKR